MLDVAFMGLHVAQMTSPADMRKCYQMVTETSARIMGLDDYGLAVGRKANLVVLDASDPIEAIRLRAGRRAVVAKGKLIAEGPSRAYTLHLPGRPDSVSRRKK